MYLYHSLSITYLLFQLVNKEMTHAYFTFTMKYIDHSYWQALFYIHQWHEVGNRWVHEY